MEAQVEFTVSLPFKIKKKPNHYVTHCPVLDVWSQAPTKKLAIENLVKALQLFLMSCYERGVLNQVLKDCGFTPVRKIKRKTGTKNEQQVKIPLPFVIDSEMAQCRG